jgi:uncharacterized membrane protein
MSNPSNHSLPEKYPKQDFQVERIAFFSDAVFAIAITLLVLELRPPIITKGTTYAELRPVLVELKWKIASLLLSFVLIITYWMRHHTLFKHMLLLLPIVFFPFTTAFFYENVSSESELIVVPFRFFILNNVIAGITTYYFYWTVMKRYKEMSTPMPEKETMQFEGQLVILTISFLLVFILSFFSFKLSLLGMLPIVFYKLYSKFTANKKSTPKKNIHAEQNDSTTH